MVKGGQRANSGRKSKKKRGPKPKEPADKRLRFEDTGLNSQQAFNKERKEKKRVKQYKEATSYDLNRRNQYESQKNSSDISQYRNTVSQAQLQEASQLACENASPLETKLLIAETARAEFEPEESAEQMFSQMHETTEGAINVNGWKDYKNQAHSSPNNLSTAKQLSFPK